MFLHFLSFEIRYWLRSWMLWIFLAIISLMFFGAVSICKRLRSALGSDLSSVTSMTMLATCLPNSLAIVSDVTS